MNSSVEIIESGLYVFFFYLDELCVIGAVRFFAAVSRSRVLPVEIQAVKVVLAQVLDGGLGEVLARLRVGDELREARRALVPAADGQQRPQVLVVRLETVEFRIAT